MMNNDFLAESANINELVEEAEGMNILTKRQVTPAPTWRGHPHQMPGGPRSCAARVPHAARVCSRAVGGARPERGGSPYRLLPPPTRFRRMGRSTASCPTRLASVAPTRAWSSIATLSERRSRQATSHGGSSVCRGDTCERNSNGPHRAPAPAPRHWWWWITCVAQTRGADADGRTCYSRGHHVELRAGARGW